jgi:hypothetical protein
MASINRTPDTVKSDSAGGRIRETGIFVGIVKGNVDPQRMGRLSVYIPEFGGDPESEQSWYVVSYASPFAGATNLDNNKESGEEAKKMSGTQISYGFWAVPPDLNNEVLVCFANGDTTRGFWFGCLYQQFMNHMVPGVALNLSTDDSVNKLNLPPVCEYNRKDDENASKYWDPKRPIFEPLYEGLREQGLFTDAERGPGTSSARREAPSKVYGLSTPRGHNIHIDEEEKNEFIRLRTRSGVQLLLHETTGYIYMISKKGNSWMEISDEGINMYSKGTINMRAEGGINSHTEKEHRSQAENHHTRATSNSTHATEGDHTHETKGNRTTTTDGTDSKNAKEHTRNSDKITDAKGPQQSSLSKEKSQEQTKTTANAPTKAGDRRNDRNGLSNGMSGLLNKVEGKFGPQFVTSGNSDQQKHGQNSDHNWNINAPSDAVDLRTRNMSSGEVRNIANYVNSQPGGWALIESDHLHISYRGAGNVRGRTGG